MPSVGLFPCDKTAVSSGIAWPTMAVLPLRKEAVVVSVGVLRENNSRGSSDSRRNFLARFFIGILHRYGANRAFHVNVQAYIIPVRPAKFAAIKARGIGAEFKRNALAGSQGFASGSFRGRSEKPESAEKKSTVKSPLDSVRP